MGTLKRLNEAKKQLSTAESAMPGAYTNQYAGQINDKLGQLAELASGFDYNTAADSYQDYRRQAGVNAANSAASALGTANALSGGYGTADWATSAANQAASASLAGADTSLAALRGNALEQWKQELSGTNSILNSLLNQQSLERSEYDGSVADAANWRDYLSSKVDTARQENSNFWNNVWTTVKGLGSAALEGYDAYKGYSTQKLSMQAAGRESAWEQFMNGNVEGAKQLMEMYGMDPAEVDSWAYSPQDSMDYTTMLTTYMGLVSSGQTGAAAQFAAQVGLDTTGLDTYEDLLKRQQQAAASTAAVSGSGTRSSGSGTSDGSSGTSSSGKTSGTFTNSQLQTMAKAYQSMDESDPLWDFYHNTLTEYGWLTPSPAESLTTTQQAAVEKVNQGLIGSGKTSGTASGTLTDSTRKNPWTTYGTVDSTDGADMLTGASGSMTASSNPNANNYNMALNTAQQMQRQGYSADEIGKRLLMENYSDEVLIRVSAALGL